MEAGRGVAIPRLPALSKRDPRAGALGQELDAVRAGGDHDVVAGALEVTTGIGTFTFVLPGPSGTEVCTFPFLRFSLESTLGSVHGLSSRVR